MSKFLCKLSGQDCDADMAIPFLLFFARSSTARDLTSFRSENKERRNDYGTRKIQTRK